jgi:hypothetical protein
VKEVSIVVALPSIDAIAAERGNGSHIYEVERRYFRLSTACCLEGVTALAGSSLIGMFKADNSQPITREAEVTLQPLSNIFFTHQSTQRLYLNILNSSYVITIPFHAYQAPRERTQHSHPHTSTALN